MDYSCVEVCADSKLATGYSWCEVGACLQVQIIVLLSWSLGHVQNGQKKKPQSQFIYSTKLAFDSVRSRKKREWGRVLDDLILIFNSQSPSVFPQINVWQSTLAIHILFFFSTYFTINQVGMLNFPRQEINWASHMVIFSRKLSPFVPLLIQN